MSFLAQTGRNIGRAAISTKDWVAKNPGTAAGVVITPVAAVAAVPIALGAAGFTAGGVAAGSLAAGAQAGIGNVVAGSGFALLQSAGAGGAALGVVQGVAGAAAAAVSGGTAFIIQKTGRKGEETSEEEETRSTDGKEDKGTDDESKAKL